MALKPLLVAAGVIALNGVALSNVYDWGFHNVPQNGALRFFSTGGTPLPFSDDYRFEVAPGVMLTGSSVSEVENRPFTGISDGSYSIFSYGSDGFYGTADDIAISTFSYGAAMGAVNSHPLGSGKYYYRVSGIADGTIFGQYQVDSFATVTPEPGASMVMVAGLAGLTLLARRRV